jgi:hypothetical protein
MQTVQKITRETYGAAAERYIERNGGQVYYIAARPARRWKREEVSPEQWRAWISYFAQLGLPCRLYQARGYISAPAPWPHIFDPSLAIEERESA